MKKKEEGEKEGGEDEDKGGGKDTVQLEGLGDGSDSEDSDED